MTDLGIFIKFVSNDVVHRKDNLDIVLFGFLH